MTPTSDNPGSPNFLFLIACLFAALAWLAWPEQGDYFGQGLLAYFMAMTAVLACAQAFLSIRIRFRRRSARASANVVSGAHGEAAYASLSERTLAGVHDLRNPFLVGLADGLPATVPKTRHLAAGVGTGGGKTSALAVPILFHAAKNGWSVVVSDAKPELAYICGPELERQGFRVIYNDLADIGDWKHSDCNPFEPLKEAVRSAENHKSVYTIAEALGSSLVPEPKADNKNKYFILLERDVLVFVQVALAALDPERCYPAGLLRVVSDPRQFRELCLMAQGYDGFAGDLAAQAASLLQLERENPDHHGSALQGAKNALSIFKASSVFGRMGTRHDYDARQLRDEDGPPTIIFDIMRADALSEYAKANALQQQSRLQSLRKYPEGRNVVLLVDEATNLPVPKIINDIELIRSFNVRIALLYQSEASLRRVYGSEQAEAILSNCAELVFSVSDLKRAEEISKRLGAKTIKTQSHSFDEVGKPSTSIGEVGKSLLSPDEILSLPPGEALMFLPGCRAIRLKRVPYYHVQPFKDWAGENPHERHPRSSYTEYTLVYGKDASQLGPPRFPGARKVKEAVWRMEARRDFVPRVGFFRFRDFIWVPVVALTAFAIFQFGTPHLLLEHRYNPRAKALHSCSYIGLSGLQTVRQPVPCESVRFLRFQSAEDSR